MPLQFHKLGITEKGEAYRRPGVQGETPLGLTGKKSESEVTQSCPTLCDPMDCSPPGSSVHGIFQARVVEWVAISFSNWEEASVKKRGPCVRRKAVVLGRGGKKLRVEVGKEVSRTRD